jgi:WD40 repeat protein
VDPGEKRKLPQHNRSKDVAKKRGRAEESAETNGAIEGIAGKRPRSQEMGSEANGRPPDSGQKPPLLKTPGGNLVDRASLVRCLIEGLKDLGYQVSAQALEEESHVTPQPIAFVKLREAVLQSDWKMAEELVGSSQECFSVPLQLEIRVLMGEQRYLEAVESGNISEALSVLRERLSPIHQNSQRLAFLASMLMFSNQDTLRKEASWPGGDLSRVELVKAVQRLLPTAVPEARLLGLMDQAVSHQVSKCVAHGAALSFDLLRDHACEQDAQDQCVAVLTEHTDEVNYVAFSPNASQLASASKDKTIILWDLTQGAKVEPRRKIKVDAPVFMLEWSACGSLLLTASEFKVSVWYCESGEKAFELELEDVTGCCWLPKGAGFVTSSGNGKISVWDLDGNLVSFASRTPHILDMIHGWEEGVVRDVKVCGRDNPKLVAATEDKILSYDLTRKEESARLELDDVLIMSLAVSSDGYFAVVACTDCIIHTLELVVVDLRSSSVLTKLAGPSQSMYVIRCSFGGPESNFVLSGSEDSRVYVWQRSSGSLLRILDGHSAPVNHVAWSPRLLASCSDDRSIRLWGARNKPTTPTPSSKPGRARNDTQSCG